MTNKFKYPVFLSEFPSCWSGKASGAKMMGIKNLQITDKNTDIYDNL